MGDFAEDVGRWLNEAYLPADGAPNHARPRIREVARLLWTQPGLGATAIYRMARWCRVRRLRGLPVLLGRLNVTLFGIEISMDASIGPGLYIAHPVGMVIVPAAMGANASLIASVTIGMRNTHAFPRIGDGVFIGAGARVLGDVYLGDGCRIGANAVVLTDIPPRATAVGVPARAVEAPQ